MTEQRVVEIKYSTLALQHLVLKLSTAQIASHYGITAAEVSKALVDLGIKKARGAATVKSYIINYINDAHELNAAAVGRPASPEPTATSTPPVTAGTPAADVVPS